MTNEKNDKQKENENEEMYEYMDAYLGYCEHYDSWLIALPDDFTVEDVFEEMNLRSVFIPVFMTNEGISINVDDLNRTDNTYDDAKLLYRELTEAKQAIRSLEDFYRIVVKGDGINPFI